MMNVSNQKCIDIDTSNVDLDEPLLLVLPSVGVEVASASSTTPTTNHTSSVDRTGGSGSNSITSNKNEVLHVVDTDNDPPLSHTAIMNRLSLSRPPLHLVANTKVSLMSILIMVAVDLICVISSDDDRLMDSSSMWNAHHHDTAVTTHNNIKKNSEASESHNIKNTNAQTRTLTRPLKNHCQELYLTQTLDHFGGVAITTPKTNNNNRTTSTSTTSTTTSTFQQRYFVCREWWRASSTDGPIFFYLGNESNVELYLNHTGLMWEHAQEFGAMLVFAEHRYFGKSVPSFQQEQ
jgi:hypothetical protein